jgi:hypothetical protein
MEPPSPTATVVGSLFGQGIRVQPRAPVVACSFASGRPPGMLRPAPTERPVRRPPVTPANALRCAHCGDVIGVYEPLILAGDGEVRETSVAAERDVGLARSARYHRACYAARTQDAAGP